MFKGIKSLFITLESYVTTIKYFKITPKNENTVGKEIGKS